MILVTPPLLTLWNMIVLLLGGRLHLVPLQGVLQRRIIARARLATGAVVADSNRRVVGKVADNRCCKGTKILSQSFVNF